MIHPTFSPSHIAARVIPAIGRPDFSEHLQSAYRALADCDFRSAMHDAEPILAAAQRRHHELMERAARTTIAPSRVALMQWARERGLSAREAEIVAGLALGHSQADIAGSSGLTLNSVITYRRRAYQKLEVADRRELRALCERMIVLAAP